MRKTDRQKKEEKERKNEERKKKERINTARFFLLISVEKCILSLVYGLNGLGIIRIFRI